MDVGRLDLVTVVFGEELPLLALQARSVARFVEAADIGRILVVVNDVHEDRVAAAVEALRPLYGPLADRLEVVRPDALASARKWGAAQRAALWYVRHGRGPIMRRLPRRDRLASGWRGNPGWSMQQAEKLLVANLLTAPYAVILDAKNYFVAPVGLDTFVAKDGRARTRWVAVEDLQRGWIRASFDKLGLAAPVPEAAPPTTTPVALDAATMREGLALIEDRLGPLEAFFSLRKGRATEFMLLYAAIDRGLGEWRRRFADGLPEPVTVFAKGGDAAVSEALAAAVPKGALMMGLHRRVLRRIGEDTRAALARSWVGLGLFGTLDEARALLSEAKS
jgi:hypothetical protein